MANVTTLKFQRKNSTSVSEFFAPTCVYVRPRDCSLLLGKMPMYAFSIDFLSETMPRKKRRVARVSLDLHTLYVTNVNVIFPFYCRSYWTRCTSINQEYIWWDASKRTTTIYRSTIYERKNTKRSFSRRRSSPRSRPTKISWWERWSSQYVPRLSTLIILPR